ncbi:Sulfite exporter TauE/SafE family protein 3 [Vitis vinifera]|uniref:Sulfite exporter TauE/SafE family protein 3 n=1 Tax=Vitis vinifera TaxID=29760 RepID=A0A438CHH9_VITVI|nr:Sulfite exporter TauE/SafE family protein 3 [Vitis vinifera]
MARLGVNQRAVAAVAATSALVVCLGLVMMSGVGNAERLLKADDRPAEHLVNKNKEPGFLSKVVHFLWQSGKSSYQHVWPDMKFGWKLVVASIIGFFGAALGSVGGVGGGGIFVPMLTLIVGFDPKSSTAISKCMIMGAAGSTVYYNMRLRHPTLDMPIIDYDLALLFQPMLMLGISIGVAFNVIFADWMVTVLLIILFLGTSTKALFKGIETWKKETIMKKEAARLLEAETKPTDNAGGGDYRPLPSGPATIRDDHVPIIYNICWKELALLVYVWVAFLAVQIVKTYTVTCSIEYWVLNCLQGDCIKGKGSHKLEDTSDFSLLFMWDSSRLSGWIAWAWRRLHLGTLFLELGIPPQVASATSTFSMAFSSSMSVVQYHLLRRFPVPYASYFVLVATIAALVGQHVVRKVIKLVGRASIIIFILALTIFISAISLGGVGIMTMVEKLANNEYMGFDDLCYQS